MQRGAPRAPDALQRGFNPHPARGPDATTSPFNITGLTEEFQSSSSPRAGCNSARDERVSDGCRVFQSSSRPRAGCNSCCGSLARWLRSVSILIQPEGRMQPARRLAMRSAWAMFQSSSSPRAGCNRRVAQRRRGMVQVSILIQPEGRMQLLRDVYDRIDPSVSILIQPEGRMQQSRRRCGRCGEPCFNPHPARGPDATRSWHRTRKPRPSGFNPHPARGPDATPSGSPSPRPR